MPRSPAHPLDPLAMLINPGGGRRPRLLPSPWPTIAMLLVLLVHPLGPVLASEPANPSATQPATSRTADPRMAAVHAKWAQGESAAALQIIAEQKIGAGRKLAEEGLGSDNPEVVAFAIRALQSLGPLPSETLEKVTRHLRHENANVRLEAIQAVTSAGDDASLIDLIELAQNPDKEYRQPFILAVRLMVKEGLPGEPAAWTEWYATAHAAAEQALRGAEPSLTSADEARAIKAIRVLTGYRTFRSMMVQRLAKLLTHPSPAVAGAARLAITELGGPAAREISDRLTASASAAAARQAEAEAAAAAVLEAANRNKAMNWMVPLGLIVGLIVIVILLGWTPQGRKVRAGTARFIRNQAQKPGARGMTARLVRSSGSLAEKGTRMIKKAVQRVSWGGK